MRIDYPTDIVANLTKLAGLDAADIIELVRHGEITQEPKELSGKHRLGFHPALLLVGAQDSDYRKNAKTYIEENHPALHNALTNKEFTVEMNNDLPSIQHNGETLTFNGSRAFRKLFKAMIEQY